MEDCRLTGPVYVAEVHCMYSWCMWWLPPSFVLGHLGSDQRLAAVEEGVQAYGGSYSSLPLPAVFVMNSELCDFPCYEIAMSRLSDGFEKQILAPTVPRCVHANDLSFEVCVSLVVNSLFC